MSFLSGLTHLTGDVAAPVFKGVGAVLPGSEGNRLSSIGASIANPNVTYSGTLNPLALTNTGGAAWTTSSATNNHTANAGQPVNTDTPGVGVTGGSISSGPSSAQVAANNQAIGVANSALDRLPNQLDVALGNIHSQFGQQNNALDSGKAQAENSYDTSTTQNAQQLNANHNQINDQASSGLRGLLRLLGQHGAGGSSAASYAAPDAVGQLATQQNSGAGQTYGQNQQGLDTNWNNYLTGYGSSKQQLNDWQTQQTNNAQATSDQNKISLLNTLAGLQSSPGTAQPFIDQINALSGQVDNLGRLNPTYTGSTPTYTAPSVSSYTVDQNAAPTVSGGPTDTGSTPWLNMLLGAQKKQPQAAF